jgi:hypothetical protein
VNSSTGPPPRSKAPAGICIVFMPGTAGVVLKMKSINVLLFDKVNESAGIPFTVKSLASRVAGSTGSLTSRVKSIGCTEMIAPQVRKGLVTKQGVAVSEATPTRNVIVAIIKVAVRVIFTFHYHFAIAVRSTKDFERDSS